MLAKLEYSERYEMIIRKVISWPRVYKIGIPSTYIPPLEASPSLDFSGEIFNFAKKKINKNRLINAKLVPEPKILLNFSICSAFLAGSAYEIINFDKF